MTSTTQMTYLVTPDRTDLLEGYERLYTQDGKALKCRFGCGRPVGRPVYVFGIREVQVCAPDCPGIEHVRQQRDAEREMRILAHCDRIQNDPRFNEETGAWSLGRYAGESDD